MYKKIADNEIGEQLQQCSNQGQFQKIKDNLKIYLLVENIFKIFRQNFFKKTNEWENVQYRKSQDKYELINIELTVDSTLHKSIVGCFPIIET